MILLPPVGTDTAAGQKLPIRAQRVLAHTLPRSAGSVSQAQGCRFAAAGLMVKKQHNVTGKLSITGVLGLVCEGEEEGWRVGRGSRVSYFKFQDKSTTFSGLPAKHMDSAARQY